MQLLLFNAGMESVITVISTTDLIHFISNYWELMGNLANCPKSPAKKVILLIFEQSSG